MRRRRCTLPTRPATTKSWRGVLTSLGLVQQVRGDLQEADRHLGESLQISQREGYNDVLAPTLRTLSAQAYWQGRFQRAIHFGQDSVTVSRDTHNDSIELSSLAFLCLAATGVLGTIPRRAPCGARACSKRRNETASLLLGVSPIPRDGFTGSWAISPVRSSMIRRASNWDGQRVLRTWRCSALINLGFDYLVLGQHARAVSYLEPTLDRVEREAFGHHRWRWKMRLCTWACRAILYHRRV